MMYRNQLLLLVAYIFISLSASAQSGATTQSASAAAAQSAPPPAAQSASGAAAQSIPAQSPTQPNDALLKDSGWSYHLQFTGIIQWHPTFSADYSGQNSLTTKQERAYSVTTTAYLGRKL